ncbi:MAG: AAA family ATPase [Sandaracinus sp.]|nr:AAA family ATPase [Myxococcales bacterium]MAT29860.1 AAA family ATPase [Sandaracinus sp.]
MEAPMKPARTGVLTTNAGGEVVLRRLLVRVVSGASKGAEAVLEDGTMVIGSHPDADLVVDDGAVSRFHVELGLLSDGVRVRDLGSTNGTYVGDSRVESVVLHPAAEIRVGRTRIELVPADLPAPEAPPELDRFGPLVGSSAAMRRVFGLLQRAAASDAPLLIEGEAGTGKSAAAQALHAASARKGGPLVVLDLAVGGDVTSAAAAAEGGTLVLDRLERLSGPQAAHLVASLDARERGSLDVRPIGLSRVDLRRRVEEGALRRDLYFHLAALRVVLPPLREHREDVPLLVGELAARLGHPGMTLSAEELAPLGAHRFEGNVRELARLVEQLLVTAAPARPSQPPPPMADVAGLPFKEAKEKLVDAFERRYVAALLQRHDGNVSRAAAEAGLDRNYLARLAKKHGLR